MPWDTNDFQLFSFLQISKLYPNLYLDSELKVNAPMLDRVSLSVACLLCVTKVLTEEGLT
ncbi:hypothetical protein COO91_11143 (plasmid) [Nostoc flagelliforme CCNUN1]|uniref:Uncharacterized protein n=1 Tax=Nostoc flagelliforme CCNUN1 TaxID=2038116 RepID=A0A2K8TB46_9NOSO|nr:hypothetical protein COO91_11143 [Nostoc flagelliforme CCNUN1]